MARKQATQPATQPATAPATAPAVALRGGPAVTYVQVNPATVYHSKAPHNVAWWQAITSAATAAPAPVAALVATQANPQGVPGHFVGYCLRRGYLVAAQAE